jgi:hypothetical protein
MCQAVVRRLFNPSERCHVRKVARLLAQALSHYSQIAVEHLDNLEPEERNRVYKMLDLKVLAHEDGNLEVKWTLGGGLCRDNEPLLPGSSRTLGR